MHPCSFNSNVVFCNQRNILNNTDKLKFRYLKNNLKTQKAVKEFGVLSEVSQI